MPDEKGRLGHDELTTIRGGVSKKPSLAHDMESVAGIPIDALVNAVMLDRYDAMHNAVQMQAEKVKAMNDDLRVYGQLKTLLDQDMASGSSADMGKYKQILGEDRFAQVFKDIGKAGASGSLSDLDRTKLGQRLDTLTTAVTNLQSAEYTKLQDYAQKLNQALELSSTTLKKFNDLKDSVIRNI